MAKKTGKSNNPGLYIFIFLIITSIFIPAQALFAADYTWVGSGGLHGGDDSSWDDPLNWEEVATLGVAASDYPRTGSDTARFDISATVTVGVSVAIDKLEVNDALSLILSAGGSVAVDLLKVNNTILDIDLTAGTFTALATEAEGAINVSGDDIALGDLEATGDLDITNTDGDITIGDIILGGDLDITNTGHSLVIGTLTGNTNSCTLEADSITLGGTVSSVGTLDIKTGSSITLPQITATILEVTVVGDIDGGALVVGGGSTFSATGDIDLSLGNDLGTSVTITAANDLKLTNTNATIGAGALTLPGSLGDVVIDWRTDLTLPGFTATTLDVTVVGDIGGGALTVGGGSIFSVTGDIDLSLGNDLGTSVAVVAANDLKLTNISTTIGAGALTLPGSLGDVVIDWGTALTLPGFTATSLDVTVAGDIGGGALTVGGGSTFSATGDIDLSLGNDLGTSVAVVAANDLKLTNISTTIGAGALTLPGSLGDVVIDWGTALTLPGFTATTLTVEAASITLSDDITTTGLLSLESTTGSVTQATGVLDVGGQTTITSTGYAVSLTNLSNSFTGAVNVIGTIVTLTTGGNIELGTISATSLTVEAASITMSDDITTTGLLSLESTTGSITQSGGTLDVGGITTLDSTTSITLGVDNVFRNTVTVAGIGSGEDLTITNKHTSSVALDFTAPVTLGDVTIDWTSGLELIDISATSLDVKATSITLSGDITTTGLLSLESTTGSITQSTGTLDVGGQTTLDSTTSITLGVNNRFRNTVTVAGIGSGEDLTITNTHTSLVALDFTAPVTLGDVIIDWGSDLELIYISAASLTVEATSITLSGDITTTGLLSLESTAGSITQPTGTLDVGGQTTITSTGYAVSLINPSNSFTGAVNVIGTIVTLTTGGNIELGTINATTLDVKAASITMSDDITTTGLLSLESTTGSITQTTGKLDVGGQTTLDSTTSITLGVDNVFRNTVTVAGIGSGEDLTITNKHTSSVALDFTAPVTLGDVTIDWTSGLELIDISATSLDVKATSITLSGDIITTGLLSLESTTGNITQSGGTLDVGGQTTITSTGYAVSLTNLSNSFTGAVNVIGTIVTLTTGGSIELGTISATSLTVEAASITLSDDITTTDFLSLESNPGGITQLTGTLEVGGETTLDSRTIITLGASNVFKDKVTIARIGTNQNLTIINTYTLLPVALDFTAPVTLGDVTIDWTSGLELIDISATSLDVKATSITLEGIINVVSTPGTISMEATAGDITQASGTVSAVGGSVFSATGDIDLSLGNNLGTSVTITAANDLKLTNTNATIDPTALTLPIPPMGDVTIDWGTDLTLPGFTAASLDVKAHGPIGQGVGAITVTGTTDITIKGGTTKDILFGNSANKFDDAITIGVVGTINNLTIYNASTDPGVLNNIPAALNEVDLRWYNTDFTLNNLQATKLVIVAESITLEGIINVVSTPGTISMEATAGDITQASGTVSATGLSSFSATGDITLDNIINNFTVEVVSAASATFIGAAGIELGDITTTGAFSVTAGSGGTITQAAVPARLNIGGDSDFLASGSITLYNPNNNFGADVDLIGGGESSIRAGAGGIAFGTVSLGANDLKINSGGTVTGSITCRNLLLLGAGPYTITGTGIITLAGDTTGTISFTNSTVFTVGSVTVGIILPNSATGITVAGASNITLSASGHLITVAENITAASGNIEIGASSGDEITITANTIETTSGGNITFAGDVEIYNASGVKIISTGGDITFDGTVNAAGAGTDFLTLTAGTGDILFSKSVGDSSIGVTIEIESANNVTFVDTVECRRLIQTTATGTTHFNNTVTLNNPSATTALALIGTNFTFSGAVTTTGNGNVSITNSGTLEIESGADFVLAGSFTQNGSGPVSLDANITTANASISFTGAVTLGDDIIISSRGTLGTGTGNSITFGNQVAGGSNMLTIRAGSGAVSLNGTPSSYSSSGTGGGLDVASSGSIAVAGALSAGSGHINMLSAGTVTLNGAVTTTNAGTVTITNGGLLTLNNGADFTLAGSFTQNGAGSVTLGADITITTSNQSVTFARTVNGGSNLLTINAGSGAVELNGTASSYSSSGTGGGLDIASSGSILIAGTLSAGSEHINLVSTGTIMLNGAVTTNSAGTATIANGALLTISNGANFTLAGSFTQSGTGAVSLGANISTTNNPISFTGTGTVTLATPTLPPITLSTTGGDVTIDNPVNGGSNLLRITAGSGDVVFTNASSYSSGTTGGLNIVSSGNITVEGTLSAGSGHINMVSDGTITLSGAVSTTNSGNVTITNSDMLIIESTAKFNPIAGNFLQNGNGEVASSGDLIATGTIIFNKTVYFAGELEDDNVTISTSNASLTPIIFHEDVYIYLPGLPSPPVRNISFGNNFSCRNFVLYSGRVNLNGKVLTTSEDFVALGPGYNINDSSLVAPDGNGLFAYNHPLRAVYGMAMPNANIVEGLTCGGAFAPLDNATISVGKNFYVNRCNMTVTSSSWELEIPNNESSASAFAEAYNMTVSDCTVIPRTGTTAWVAAANGVTATNSIGVSSGWATTPYSLMTGKTTLTGAIDWDIATGIDISNSYSSGGSQDIGCITVFDDVIRIQIDPNSESGIMFENSNNEIAKAIARGALKINGNAIDVTAYVDRECTTLTSAHLFDIAVFYLKADDTWNTDATGSSPGHTNSTDMSGVRKNFGATIITPNIYAPKATAAGIYFSLLDNRKNRITHSPVFADVADFCRPVVVSIETGRDPGTAATYNWHNYFQITYSERVDIGTDPRFVGASPTAANVLAQKDFNLATQYGGHLYESVANTTVTMSGYFSYPGTFKSGSKNGAGVLQEGEPSNALFRIGPSDSINDPHGLRIYVVGYSTDSAIWPGYMYGVSSPEGMDAVIYPNQEILDARGNILYTHIPIEITPVVNYRGAFPVVPHWKQPVIAPYQETENTKEVVIVDTTGNGLTNRLEFHVHIPYTPTWSGLHPEDGFYGPPPPGEGTYGLGKGIRETTIYNASYNAFGAFIIALDDTVPIFYSMPGPALVSSVNNPLFNPLRPPIDFSNDTYFSFTFDDSVLVLDSYLAHVFSYDSTIGGITDLAGNLLKSETSAMTVAPTPPVIQYTIASAGGTKVYVKFSEHVFRVDGNTVEINETNFEITGISGYNITSVEAITRKPSSTGEKGLLDAFFHLDTPLTPDDLLAGRIKAKAGSDGVCNSSNLEMIDTIEYRISNFAIGLVEPIWAMDSFDTEGQSSANVTIRDFMGKDKLRASDITLEVKINTTNDHPITMFFDADPPVSTRVAPGGFWLPTIFRNFNIAANNAARALGPVFSNGALRDFVIPGSDSEMTEGKDIEFIFNFAGLYTGYLSDPNDPRTINTWKIPIRGIKKQRGGVTILNNVINVSRGEKTVLMYDLPKTGAVTINIFSLSGDVVKTLVKGTQPQGSYSYTWDGTNTGGRKVARGIYFIRVVGPDIDEYRKVMVVKDR